MASDILKKGGRDFEKETKEEMRSEAGRIITGRTNMGEGKERGVRTYDSGTDQMQRGGGGILK